MHGLPPRLLEGLTVGQSLLLIAIGRACHATSKRGFADWAKDTSLGQMAGVDIQKLDSQHFWDQMDQMPLVNIGLIEQDIVSAAIKQFGLHLDTLLYDGTNFFTFIASTNLKPKLPARAHNKQKRNDLRQVSVAMLCTRQDGVPLWHHTYEGQVSDARCFESVLPLIKERLKSFKAGLSNLTIVFDKGNVSKANQQRVDELKLHYVTGMTVASQKKLVETANQNLSPVVLNNEEIVMAYRTQCRIWGKKRTVVVLISETLKAEIG
ncbi:IS1634 family transposase [Candidatus Acetothermia bacterium]|nr:IS1634 family transposase [Candidatus Acetothermia bacterium]